MKSIAVSIFLFGFFLTGCSEKCRSSCDKLYDETECGLQRPGTSQDVLKDACIEYCTEAMRTGGELNDYDPYSRQNSTSAVTLDNRTQAALWMECVEENSCERLDYRSAQGGYCQPVW